MLFNVLCTLIAVHVLSEIPPAPPRNVHVDNWLLTWLPTTEEEEVTYTVQYSSFDSDVWTDVPACVHISLNCCNVISTKVEGELGCVMLRVQAERRGLTSTPVKACSRHGDSCTPDFSLTAVPGSLTVHLSRNHSLALEHGEHLKHRVYYGKEGEPRQEYEHLHVASVTISELLEGQRYCTEVQYVFYDMPVGLATCTQCEVIPKSRKDSKQSGIIAAVVLVVVLLVLIPVLAYFIIFQRGTIKQWLSPYRIPEDKSLENESSHPPPASATGPDLRIDLLGDPLCTYSPVCLVCFSLEPDVPLTPNCRDEGEKRESHSFITGLKKMYVIPTLIGCNISN
ncbi:interferon gamma receptor 2 isoform X2 [Pseudoliparis swirei]|uniref:interferon gamma receptor 2 isoform X2 n=1 Tax=Pseudoliparis swirei TaxID=2059687 RepID=UPI0024BE98F2|nr:interferon gamma receptor 2 isoform X2 [Pseudoliparis swirei]